jgi:methionyl-tRNA formyltransferase
MSLRVVFFGNSEGAFSNRHFQALLASPCRVVGAVDVPPARRVSTNLSPVRGSGFAEEARRQGIPVFEPAGPDTPEFVNAVRALCPDLFLAAGYLSLLGAELLAVPRLAVNFHASLLPAYRGKHPLFWALRNGERRAGLTVHLMDTGFDTGDILYQVSVRVRPDETVAGLYDRIMARSLPLVSRLISDVEQGSLRPRPQPVRGASHYSSVREEDLRLDWSRPAGELRRWIRLSPGQCFHPIAGTKVYFLDAGLAPCLRSAPPGTLVELGKLGRESVSIATGKGALRVGKVRMSRGGERGAAEALRELGLKEGAAL